MRKLSIKDAFTLARIIKSANIKEEIADCANRIAVKKNSKDETVNTEAVGLEFVITLLTSLSNKETEQEFYSLLADIRGDITADDVSKLSIPEVLDNVKAGLHNHHTYSTIEGILRLPRYYKVEKEMDEEAMDVNKQFYIKQTTHTTRARVDSIRYKVNVNTMEQSSVDHLELNEIGRVVFTTGKALFFDPYRRNKQTGSFILIDPITNNTSAVGMIIDRVDAKDMVTEDALATLNLPEMGIGEEHYEAIRKVCEELGRQGVSVKCITEKR